MCVWWKAYAPGAGITGQDVHVDLDAPGGAISVVLINPLSEPGLVVGSESMAVCPMHSREVGSSVAIAASTEHSVVPLQRQGERVTLNIFFKRLGIDNK